MIKSLRTGTASKSTGFTLIELLVVIAIIGILASIILASLSTARAKGGDAALKGTMSSMRSAAEIFYTDQGGNSYANFCTSATTTSMLSQIYSSAGATVGPITANATPGAAGAVTCHGGATGWAVQSPLKTDATMFWCVDGNGKAATSTAPGTQLPANSTQCI